MALNSARQSSMKHLLLRAVAKQIEMDNQNAAAQKHNASPASVVTCVTVFKFVDSTDANDAFIITPKIYFKDGHGVIQKQ